MTTDIRDCPPGTVPSWVIRFAYDGEEWLVLGNMPIAADSHKCATIFLRSPAYRLLTVSQFVLDIRCHVDCCSVRKNHDAALWEGDSLPEAEAAFTRIEAEWRAAKVRP